ncbi:MAG: type I-C CRISPR-associated protein Cas8c/Csd1 [Sulfobacillus sp.]
MMLQALIDYAERENLGDPDFMPVGVRWLISLDNTGKLAGVIPLVDGSDDKKPKRIERPKSDPDFVSHGRSYFLCDTLERSILFVEDADKLEKRRLNHGYFTSLIEEASNDCPGIADKLRLLVSFLRDEQQLQALHSHLVTAKAKTIDNALFAVDGESVIESVELRDWWRIRNQKGREKQDPEKSVCLVTGRYGSICRTTSFIKLLGEDTKLISFNKECPAFESFGLSQAANAPISADAEVKVSAAFNALIEKSSEKKLVFNDTIHLHWTRKPIQDDPIDPLANPDPNAVAGLLESFRSGHPPVAVDANQYYAMSLSGNGARIIVRDWLETTVSEVKLHVAEWFQDIGIVESDGAGVKHEFSLGQLLWALADPKRKKPYEALPHGAAEDLFHAALTGGLVPQTILMAALRRETLQRVSGGDSKENDKGKNTKKQAHFLTSRFALIKACLLRSPNSQNKYPQQKGDIMTACLNPESRDPSYLCGRLFAVFAELQGAALQNVNAGVVERYYASASTTPALVMGRLFRNAQFHSAKAEGEGGWKKGKAINAQKDFEAITCALGDQFPPTLDLEGQGRFALGYYHQKAEFHRRSAERREQETTGAKIEISNS